jgi:predicted permease
MRTILRKLGWFFHRRAKESDLAEELQFHLNEEAAEHGSDAARRELGNLTLVKENTRAAWGWIWLEQLAQDLRYGFRSMRHSPGFTFLAALSLALGIGANTAIFSFMDALLLRSLPVGDPQSLVVLNWRASFKRLRGSVVHSGSLEGWENGGGTASGNFPYRGFEVLRKSDVFSSLFAYFPTAPSNVFIKGQAESTSGEFVSGDYFRGLQLAPAAGRLLIEDDDRAGAQPVAVLSFNLAQRRFGDPASAVGQSILINNAPYTVAGVTPPGFFGLDPAQAPEFYLPLHLAEEQAVFLDEHYWWILMTGRLKPGVTIRQAQATLGPMFDQWVKSTAENDKERAHLPQLMIENGAGGLNTLRREYSKPLYVLFAMVSMILAIACANVSNLLLARATARRREMAVRLSIGAGRWRVVRQLLTESLLLVSLGGAAGMLFAMWGVRFLTVLLAGGTSPFPLEPELNWHVLAGAVALSMLTGIVFGLAPAIQATRVDVMPVLKELRTGDRRPRWRFARFNLNHVLLVTQIAISLLLVVGAGLFVRTLSHVQSVELGFNRESTLQFSLNAREAGHRNADLISFYHDLQQRFASIPGVRGASMAQMQLIGNGSWFTQVVPLGKPVVPDQITRILMVGPEYLSTMQIPLLAGREIDQRDRAGARPVAVVNEIYAKLNFGDQNPIGQHIVLKEPPSIGDREMEIVGVSKNIRYGDLKEDMPPIAFIPYEQQPDVRLDRVVFSLRTAGNPLAYVNTIREMVRQADPRVPVTNVHTQAAAIDQTINQEIIFARLCTGFALLALAIACVGLYATMSYMVARRTGEIGIRMALGAQRRGIVWMIMRQVWITSIIGVAIGIPAAYASSRLVESFLYGIKAHDPAALLIAIGTLLIAVLTAGYVPAARASRTDPLTALRHD